MCPPDPFAPTQALSPFVPTCSQPRTHHTIACPPPAPRIQGKKGKKLSTTQPNPLLMLMHTPSPIIPPRLARHTPTHFLAHLICPSPLLVCLPPARCTITTPCAHLCPPTHSHCSHLFATPLAHLFAPQLFIPSPPICAQPPVHPFMLSCSPPTCSLHPPACLHHPHPSRLPGGYRHDCNTMQPRHCNEDA